MVQISEIEENQVFIFSNSYPESTRNKPQFLKGISTFDTQEYLKKWDLLNHSSFVQLNYSPLYDDFHKYEFLSQLFNDENFKKNLHIADKKGNMKPLNQIISSKFKPDDFRSIKKLSTNFLNFSNIVNRLYESEIVHRESGTIQKCFDSYHDYNLTISDKLRELFIFPEDSEYNDLFDESDKNEFLYQIIKQLLTGGGLNQFEDELNPIIDTTRIVYKDLVTVKKLSEGSLKITSKVFLFDETCELEGLFPLENAPGNFLFIVIDDDKVTAWYHAYLDAW